MPNLSCVALLDGEPAGSAARGARRRPGLRRRPAGRLGDLPQAGAELEDLLRIYDDRLVGEPALGPRATEAAVREIAGRADACDAILHVACHATLEAGEPMSSGLLLSDGKLDAAELAAMRLRYPEVVLSACSTGWRPEAAEGIALTGDDVLGPARRPARRPAPARSSSASPRPVDAASARRS